MAWRTGLRWKLFCLGLALLAWPFIAAAQPAAPPKITVFDDAGAVPNADVCLYDYTAHKQYFRVTDEHGVAEFENLSGSLSLVVSKEGYQGYTEEKKPATSLSNKSVELEDGAWSTAPVCSKRPVPTLFTIDDKAATTESDRVTLQFRTSASYDQDVEFCATEDLDGCHPRTGFWVSLERPNAPGFEPAFTAEHRLSGIGKRTVHLSVRWAGGAPGSSVAASIERIPQPITVLTLTINDGAAFTTTPDVTLEWITEPLAAHAGIEFCAVVPGQTCGANDWHAVSPLGSAPGIGLRFRTQHSLSPSQLAGFLPVERSVELRVRYVAYPEITSTPILDEILLLEPSGGGAPPTATETYNIPAGQVFELASSRGWGFSFNEPTLCLLQPPPPNPNTEGFSIGTSSGCAFDLFTNGTLAPGWTFQGFQVDDSQSIPDERNCQFAEALSPTPGGRSLRTMVAVFKRPWPRCLVCLDPPIHCLRAFERVRLVGPVNSDWRTAFPISPP